MNRPIQHLGNPRLLRLGCRPIAVKHLTEHARAHPGQSRDGLFLLSAIDDGLGERRVEHGLIISIVRIEVKKILLCIL